MFITEKHAASSAAGDDDKKMDEVNGTLTSENRRQRKVIYEVIV